MRKYWVIHGGNDGFSCEVLQKSKSVLFVIGNASRNNGMEAQQFVIDRDNKL